MNTGIRLGLIVFVFSFFSSHAFSQTQKGRIEKGFAFSVPSRGERTFSIRVPRGAKRVRAVISGQSEMVSMEVAGPTGTVLCKTSTWSHMSNWRKPLKCSAGVVNNNRQRPGTWTIKIKGSVHRSKADRIRTVSGKLTVIIKGNIRSAETQAAGGTRLPINKDFTFSVRSRGERTFSILVPQGAKRIRAVIRGQSEMVSMEVAGPTGTVLCKTSTWSHISNWRKPLRCSAGVVKNNRQRPGTWTIKIKGSVHRSKADRVKTVSGKLTVTIL